MIRPITVICWILALGAGLYLYRAKHEVELIDRRIDVIARQTNDIRAESRRLLDDWIRLGEPVQLQKYSDQYLGLKAISPPQFVRLADLPNRLPAPRVADPVEPAAEEMAEAPAEPNAAPQAVGVAQAAAPDDAVEEAEADELPVPPIPPGAPTITSVSLQGVTARRPSAPRPAAAPADQAATYTRPDADPRTVEEAAARPAAMTPGPMNSGPMTPGPMTPGQMTQGPTTSAAMSPARVTPAAFAPVAGQGLPPLQAQGTGRPIEHATADVRDAAHDPRGARSPGQPAQVAARPVNAPVPHTQIGQMQTGQPQTGQPQGQSLSAQPAPPAQAQAAIRPLQEGREQRRELAVQAPGRASPPAQVQASGVRPGDGRLAEIPRAPMPRAVSPVADRTFADGNHGDPRPVEQAPRRPMSPPAGSLLGMSRGAVPIPLPAPTPVSATWPGPGTGR